MSVKSLYCRWLDELWGGKSIASELVTANFVGHWPGRDVHGPDELEQIIAQTRQQISQLSFTVELGPFSERDLVAGRWRGTGIGRDGEAISFTGNDILRLDDGGERIVEYWTGTSAS